MKRSLLFILILGFITLGLASITEYYTFNQTSGIYNPFNPEEGNLIPELSANNVLSSPISIGFIFPYGTNLYTEVKISSNGWLGLGSSQTNSLNYNQLNYIYNCPILAPLWDDLSLQMGTCYYQIAGTAPHRVFTVQYTNLKWNYTASSFFNLQVKLYETGKIEFIYGFATGAPNSPSASIGINMLPGGSEWFYSVTPGNPATVSTTTENNQISIWPGEGTIYEFNPVIPFSNDLAALSISGNNVLTVGENFDYQILIRNSGNNDQNNYQIKLLLDDEEIASLNGNPIQAGEFQTYTLSWNPSFNFIGPGNLSGKVVLSGDENPVNNQTSPLLITIQPAEIQEVTIGSGNELARIPIDFNKRNSLYECLYYPEEIGFSSGIIYSINLYNYFVNSPANGMTRIWLGTTDLPDLSLNWIPSNQLTLVFEGNIDYPAGVNTISIPLQTPYLHYPGNLVMMVQRPWDQQFYSENNNFYAQTIGSHRARKTNIDNQIFEPSSPPPSTVSGQFPKTTFLYTNYSLLNDLSCLSINGNPAPSIGSNYYYTITIKNNGIETQNNYVVRLMATDGTELSSVMGSTIAPQQTLEFDIPWIPAFEGSVSIYGEVILVGDEIETNNQSLPLKIKVYPEGIFYSHITIGEGNLWERMPMDFYLKNSLFETVYLASELNTSGLLTDIQFYNYFYLNSPNEPTKIWMGETTLNGLSQGWIPSTDLTLVFDGMVDYPVYNNDILIHLDTPYQYNGNNLVVMFKRPWDPTYLHSDGVFRNQTGDVINRTLKVASDVIDYDPANPPVNTTAQAIFPMTTFMIKHTDPFGEPVTLPSSMNVACAVTIDGLPASSGDILAAYVDVNGVPQLRGKQTIQLSDNLASCIIQIYTENDAEIVRFRIWDPNNNQIYLSSNTLSTLVNATIGSIPDNPFMIYGISPQTQSLSLAGGWNLISLNIAPPDHRIISLISAIANNVQQIKGTEGVYILNNPFSSLAALTDGKAYSILMSSPANWTVSGAPIPVSTPIPLSDGWNLAAYFPTTPLVVTEAMSSISEWLIQVKGTDGVYIPGNPYSTLTTMYPGKGYWIKINGAHNLIYPEPARTRDSSLSHVTQNQVKDEEQVRILSNSLTLLARCNAAEEGDYLLARVEGELRGKEKFISPEGFPAVLMQVYTEMSGEEISFSLLKPDGSEIVLATTLISEPGAILGDYPEFVVLESTSMEDQVILPTQLKGCYPNPFNPSTTIVFSIGEETQVNIDIYNLKGQKVRHLTSESFSRGEHKLLWDGKDDQGRKVASGIYFAEMRTPHYKKHIKMLMTK